MNKLFKDIRHSDVDAVRVAISKNITVVNEVYTAKAPKKGYWTIAATSGD